LPVLALPFPVIDPVAIAVGPIAIRWYALAYIAGLLLGWLVVRRLVRRPHWRLTTEDVDDLLFYATLGVILGGRLGYVLFYQPGHYLANPLDVLVVWRGGMSFHGGLIGVILAAWIVARRKGLGFFEITDAFAVATPIGLFFGRLANFINAELWGRPSDVPWAMVFPGAGPLPRHPSQLYEAALEGVALFLLMLWLARRPWRPEEAGRLSGAFLIGYGAARIVVEFFREPDAHLGFLLGGATMGQLLSVPMIALGIALVVRAQARGQRAVGAGRSS
jgi:phosphatidylglycerol---prolipoprotein diacylglyceryl transferase